jgi:cytochrome c oxidase assembly protein subunit 15
MLLHLFALLTAAATAVLIFAGGLVTSTGSGLSVPDWPNSYGWFMFTFPIENWVGGIFYEHSHRLIASTVGFLILVLAFWLWRAEPRRWVRRLGFIALGAVITQGMLGGITVLWYLPDPISIAHASLAQIVFCLTTAIALVTSPGWHNSYERRGRGDLSTVALAKVDDRLLQRVARVTLAVIYVQIVVGATMRHTDAGLAIPDFPWMFGHLIPDHWDPKIAVHFAHRVGALCVTVMLLATTGHVFAHHRHRLELLRPSILLLVLLTVQITLGALTILSRKEFVINSLHVVTGACVLVTTLILTLRAHRARFADTLVTADGTAGAGLAAGPEHSGAAAGAGA